MIKSPIGFLLAAAGLVLAFSPEARKTVRKLAVKGTELLLDMNDQIKARTTGPTMEDFRRRNEESNESYMGILDTDSSHIRR